MEFVEVKKIDGYLDDFLKRLSHNELKEVLNKIINFQYVKGLDNYSKELLALAVEKRIVMSVEKYCQKNQNPSHWQHLKIEAPLVKQNSNYLNGYIDLAIRDLYKPIPKNNNNINDIKRFYDKEIYRSSKLFGNRLFALPSGEKVSINDLIIAINNTINNSGFIKKEYNIKQTKEKLKNTAAMAGIVSMLGASLVFNHQDVEKNTNVTEEQVYVDEQVTMNEVSNIVETKEMENNLVEEINSEPVFVGYESNCPIEYQEYMLEMAHKYDIPFNLLITVIDNESNSLFNTNGVISEWDDYGLCQINICNHDKIYEDLGYTSSDLLNNPYKNIEAASYLIKNICDMYQEEVLNGNYENVLGTYNGWKTWKSKQTSIEYVANGIEKLNTIYNKEENELYDNVNEEQNAKSR
jgi:hypothetical protein